MDNNHLFSENDEEDSLIFVVRKKDAFRHKETRERKAIKIKIGEIALYFALDKENEYHFLAEQTLENRSLKSLYNRAITNLGKALFFPPIQIRRVKGGSYHHFYNYDEIAHCFFSPAYVDNYLGQYFYFTVPTPNNVVVFTPEPKQGKINLTSFHLLKKITSEVIENFDLNDELLTEQIYTYYNGKVYPLVKIINPKRYRKRYDKKIY